MTAVTRKKPTNWMPLVRHKRSQNALVVYTLVDEGATPRPAAGSVLDGLMRISSRTEDEFSKPKPISPNQIESSAQLPPGFARSGNAARHTKRKTCRHPEVAGCAQTTSDAKSSALAVGKQPIKLGFEAIHSVVDGAELVFFVLNHEDACDRRGEDTDDADAGQHQDDRNQATLGGDRIDVAIPDSGRRRDGPPHRVSE